MRFLPRRAQAPPLPPPVPRLALGGARDGIEKAMGECDPAVRLARRLRHWSADAAIGTMTSMVIGGSRTTAAAGGGRTTPAIGGLRATGSSRGGSASWTPRIHGSDEATGGFGQSLPNRLRSGVGAPRATKESASGGACCLSECATGGQTCFLSYFGSPAFFYPNTCRAQPLARLTRPTAWGNFPGPPMLSGASTATGLCNLVGR